MENTIKLLKSEGIEGAQDIILMTRYAALSGDKSLMALVGNSLKELILPKSPFLTYALVEYYEATRDEFAKTAAEYLLATEESAMARNKAARVFQKEEYLTDSDDPLALIEQYKATYNEEHLNKAVDMAVYLRDNFDKFFNPKDVYDFKEPSSNSCISVLFDEIARITMEKKWMLARDRQNHFIKLLAEKYPTKVSFGLCALLGDQFGYKTVVVEGDVPESLLSFYDPTTEIIAIPGDGEAKLYLKTETGLEPMAF